MCNFSGQSKGYTRNMTISKSKVTRQKYYSYMGTTGKYVTAQIENLICFPCPVKACGSYSYVTFTAIILLTSGKIISMK